LLLGSKVHSALQVVTRLKNTRQHLAVRKTSRIILRHVESNTTLTGGGCRGTLTVRFACLCLANSEPFQPQGR
jgi:hypothetical protein